jgi:hypothetical protein
MQAAAVAPAQRTVLTGLVRAQQILVAVEDHLPQATPASFW